MLLIQDIEAFFLKHSIPLEGKRPMELQEVDELLLDASLHGHSFAAFILYTVVNSERNGIETNFSSRDFLYDAYCAFMTGYMSSKTAANN